MATSSNYDFSMNGDQLITDAVRALGITDPSIPYPDSITRHRRTLNMMLKALQNQIAGLWLLRQITLFPAHETASYSLGSSGTNCTTTPIETTLSAAALIGAATISVTSATSIVASAYIGIELDDGTRQWTTVSGTPSGTTVTLAAVLTGAAAADNTVKVYVAKAQRPLKILDARWKVDDDETQMNIVDRQDYMLLSDKTEVGTPSTVFYDPQISNGVLYLWPTPDVVDAVIKMTVRYPIMDIDAASDDFELPVEWYLAILYNLANNIIPEYLDRVSNATVMMIQVRAEKELQIAKMSDAPNSIQFVPDLE